MVRSNGLEAFWQHKNSVVISPRSLCASRLPGKLMLEDTTGHRYGY